MAEGMSLTEVFVKLFFKGDTTKLKDFVNAIGEVNISSLAAAVGLGGLYEATKKLMETTGDSASAMRKFTAETGYSAQFMQRLDRASASVGVNLGETVGIVKQLQVAADALEVHGTASWIWNLLHLNPADIRGPEGFVRFLQALADPSISAGLRRIIIHELGLSDATFTLVDRLQDIQRAMSGTITVSDAMIKAADETRGAWVMAGRDWRTILDDLAEAFDPAIKAAAEFSSQMAHLAHQSPEFKFALIALTEGIAALGVVLAGTSLVAWFSGLPQIAILIGFIVAGVAALGLELDKLETKFHGTKWEGMLHALHPLLGPVLPDFAPLMPSAAAAGATTTTNHNTFNFQVAGDNARDIALKVGQTIGNIFADTYGLHARATH